jgi:hypothetical protein
MTECGPWQCSPTVMLLAQGFLVAAAVIGLGFVVLSVIEWRRARQARSDSIRLLESSQEHLRDIERQAGLPSSFADDDDDHPPGKQVH